MPTATPKASPNWRSGCTAASCARASTSWQATSTTSRRSCSRSSAARTPASWFSRSTVIADDASSAVSGTHRACLVVLISGPYIARGIDECFQFTRNVGSGWLIDDFGNALCCDSGDALGELSRGYGQRCVQDGRPAARGPRGLVGLVEA